MNDKKLLLLGGYGNTGRPMAELLLKESTVSIVIAGRDEKKAKTLAASLNESHAGERVTGMFLDASDPALLLKAFSGIDMVVVASSTAEYTEQVAGAALECGVDYFDVLYSTQKFTVLQEMRQQIEDASRCFITDGGFHPGLPAALIRHTARDFDRLDKARVGSVIQIDWSALDITPATMDEFVGEFMDFQTLVYSDGQWQRSSVMAMMIPVYIDFTSNIGPNFGRRYCIPMFLEEMRTIPELYPEIREAGFLVGGFNWFVDWLVSPVIMVALKLWPQRSLRPMGKLMLWALKRFGKPPYGTLLKAEIQGQKGGETAAAETLLFHEDGYAFTAIPAVACLLQYLDGTIHRPGLWMQASAVDPQRMMVDMERMGIQVEHRETQEDAGGS